MYLGNCKSRRFVSGRASLIKIFIYVLYIGTYYIRVNTVIYIAKRNWNAVKIVLSSLSRHPFCLLPMRNQPQKVYSPIFCLRGERIFLWKHWPNCRRWVGIHFVWCRCRIKLQKGLQSHLLPQRGTHASLEPLANMSSLGRHPFCLVPRRNQTAKDLQSRLLSQRGKHASLETLANLSSLGRRPFCLVPRRNQAAMGLRPHLLQWRRHVSL